MAKNIPFYTQNNQITSELAGGRRHYPIREDMTILKKRSYILKFGESPYTLAHSIFRDDKMYWIICDTNVTKDPMSWEAGEEIFIPEIVVENSFERLPRF